MRRKLVGLLLVVASACSGSPPQRAAVDPAPPPMFVGERRGLQLRADTIAQEQLLRAAIETDAVTIDDLVRSGALFRRGAGETVEIALRRGGKLTSILRVPASAAPIPLTTDRAVRVDTQRGGERLIATVPILTPRGDVGGVLAIRLDLAAMRRTGHSDLATR